MVDFVGGGLVGMQPGGYTPYVDYGAQLAAQTAAAAAQNQAALNNTFNNFGQQTDYYSALGAAYGRDTGGFGGTTDSSGNPAAPYDPYAQYATGTGFHVMPGGGGGGYNPSTGGDPYQNYTPQPTPSYDGGGGGGGGGSYYSSEAGWLPSPFGGGGGGGNPNFDPSTFYGGGGFSSVPQNTPPYDQASLYSGIQAQLNSLGMQPTSPGDLGYGRAFAGSPGYDPYFGSMGGGMGGSFAPSGADNPNTPGRQQQAIDDPVEYNRWLNQYNSLQGGGGGYPFQSAYGNVGQSPGMGLNYGGFGNFGAGGGIQADNPSSPGRQQQAIDDPVEYNRWLNQYNSLQGGGGYSAFGGGGGFGGGISADNPSSPGRQQQAIDDPVEYNRWLNQYNSLQGGGWPGYSGEQQPQQSAIDAVNRYAFTPPGTYPPAPQMPSSTDPQTGQWGGGGAGLYYSPEAGWLPSPFGAMNQMPSAQQNLWAGTTLVPSQYQTPENFNSLNDVSSNINANPGAFAAFINQESTWNPRNVTGSQAGLAQMAPGDFTYGRAGGQLGGLTYQDYLKATPAQQLQAYAGPSGYLANYGIMDKARQAGLDFPNMSAAQQAAFLQAANFAPGNTSWMNRWAQGDLTTPITTSPQSDALGDTSPNAMIRYYQGVLGNQ
jgi:hypothetical protein